MLNAPVSAFLRMLRSVKPRPNRLAVSAARGTWAVKRVAACGGGGGQGSSARRRGGVGDVWECPLLVTRILCEHDVSVVCVCVL
jgi:hypothetical protein